MIWPRWLARLLATLGGYFWLPCPSCGRLFAGFESGDYDWGTDSHGRNFKMKLRQMLPVLMASKDKTRDDVPRHWWGCCKACDKSEPVLWEPLE